MLLLFPLFAESLRNQNKTYFDSIQWEELQDLEIPPIPEAYKIENTQPIPYADTIDDGSIYPSLPQLGFLDYQSIEEDLLTFYDTLSAALLKRKLADDLFMDKQSFFPHLVQFMLDRFPELSHAFYGRPSFKQDGTAVTQFRLTIAPAKQQAAVINKSGESLAETERQTDTVNDPEKIQTGQDQAQKPLPIGNKSEKGPFEREPVEKSNTDEHLALFVENEQPLFIMLELAAVKDGNTWKILHIDLKGAEYANSAHKN